MSATGFRYDANANETPIEEQLEECFQGKGVFKKNIHYSHNGKSGEIDAIAILDNHMFVFECKNSLHPCDIFKLRTSYDHIKKASSQLTVFRDLFNNDINFKKYFLAKLNFNPSSNMFVKTAIVMGNRMFTGLILDNHIICNIFELTKFITDGKITKNGQDLSLWETDILRSDDLGKYLSDNSYIVTRLAELDDCEYCYSFKGKKLIYKSMRLKYKSQNIKQ